MATSGGAGGDGGAEDSLVGGEVDLDGGVATGVVDLAGVDLGDGHRAGGGGGGCGQGSRDEPEEDCRFGGPTRE